MCLFFFFFFQAEDGIRDWSVTGVQTCALPICALTTEMLMLPNRFQLSVVSAPALAPREWTSGENFSKRRFWITIDRPNVRSEERRVGKECRSRWSPYQ